ncbi:MAG: hypothetical protein ACKO85_17225 [Isosphaeraceae bacterium]
MKINARKFFTLAFCTFLFAGASSAEAVTIRYFVKQSTGLFEVKGSTGGRFVVSPTGEMITVNGVRLPVRGYTDRVVRDTEQFIATVTGATGTGNLVITYIDERTGRLTNLPGPPSTITLPHVTGYLNVPGNARFDSLTGNVRVGTTTYSKRLPVGTR